MSIATDPASPGSYGCASTVIAAICLVCGVGSVAYVRSSLTSVMTAEALAHEVNGFQDLGRRHVTVLAGSVSESYCRRAIVDLESFDSMQEAIDALLRSRVSAVVDGCADA